MQLRDKKVLLTGATGGIGRLIARLLAEQGAQLLLAGRDLSALQQQAAALADGGARVVAVELDLGAEGLLEQARTVLAKHQDIDVLINAAGVNGFAACDPSATSQYQATFMISLAEQSNRAGGTTYRKGLRGHLRQYSLAGFREATDSKQHPLPMP